MALDRRDCNPRCFPEDFPGPSPTRRFLEFRTFARPVDVRKARKTLATQNSGALRFQLISLHMPSSRAASVPQGSQRGGLGTRRSIIERISNRAVEASVNFLARKGYEILDRNWQADGAAIDVVAKDDDAIAFVAVTATIGSRGFEEPSAAG